MAQTALVAGVSAYAEFVNWALPYVGSVQPSELSQQRGEQLLHAGTTTEFCMAAALMVLDGTIDLSTIDHSRLDHTCREIAHSVRRTRELVTEWVSGRAGGEHPLAPLAGSWGQHESDDDVLREIYTSRSLDSE